VTPRERHTRHAHTDGEIWAKMGREGEREGEGGRERERERERQRERERESREKDRDTHNENVDETDREHTVSTEGASKNKAC
jgi:hypothetical protein